MASRKEGFRVNVGTDAFVKDEERVRRKRPEQKSAKRQHQTLNRRRTRRLWLPLRSSRTGLEEGGAWSQEAQGWMAVVQVGDSLQGQTLLGPRNGKAVEV